MNLSDAGTTEAESTHGPAGSVFRNVRQEQAARKLAEVTPLLTETLTHHWSTGQGTRVRHILWSLYSCSHLVNLGDACSGLDAILRVSGEFSRFDREETATPEGLPVIYPPTPASAETLRQLADSAERSTLE
jgi:hypothetical protein